MNLLAFLWRRETPRSIYAAVLLVAAPTGCFNAHALGGPEDNGGLILQCQEEGGNYDSASHTCTHPPPLDAGGPAVCASDCDCTRDKLGSWATDAYRCRPAADGGGTCTFVSNAVPMAFCDQPDAAPNVDASDGSAVDGGNDSGDAARGG